MTALESEAPTMPFWKLAFKAGRAHQWAKNALVAVPLLTSHKFAEPRLLFATLIAIASLSCLASATYILNDLLDIESDRLHPSKRRRPIASGAISLSRAILLGMGYAVVGALLASLLPRAAIALLALYIICTLSYSFYLKRKLLIDVLVLAGLYTMRVLLGGGATRIPISFWLLVFSIFVFVSLALAKRAIELGGGGAQPANSRRAYMSSDLQALAAVGTSSGVAATLVLALYLHSPEVRALYPQPALLWLLCPLFLYWFGRLWVMIARKWVDDDPVVFLLHDRASRITGIAALVVVILATLARDLPLTWITR